MNSTLLQDTLGDMEVDRFFNGDGVWRMESWGSLDEVCVMLGAGYVNGNLMDLMNGRVSMMVGDGRGSISGLLVSYQLRNNILKRIYYL